jgi:hypothetical protein
MPGLRLRTSYGHERAAFREIHRADAGVPVLRSAIQDHRNEGGKMNKPSCNTCQFFDKHSGGSSGFCRRNAPGARDAGVPPWPVVQGERDWCGEWKSRDATKPAPLPPPVELGTTPPRFDRPKGPKR